MIHKGSDIHHVKTVSASKFKCCNLGNCAVLIRVLSLPFNSVVGGFDDTDVREFLKDKELISSTDYLFVKNEIPYLVFVLKYYPGKKIEIESS